MIVGGGHNKANNKFTSGIAINGADDEYGEQAEHLKIYFLEYPTSYVVLYVDV